MAEWCLSFDKNCVEVKVTKVKSKKSVGVVFDDSYIGRVAVWWLFFFVG